MSPAASRGLALVILATLIALVYFAIAQPVWQSYLEDRDSIEQLGAALARYREVGQERERRQAMLDALKERQAGDHGFLQGNNETLAAATIQNRIKSLAEASRGELKSTQILPSQEDGKFRRVAVRAQMSLNLAAAQRVLHGLEASIPVLFLDNVTMRARSDRRRGESEDDPTLDLRFDAYGYFRAPG